MGLTCIPCGRGIAEVIGYSGPIDYVEFTSQYAPYDLFALDNFARAIELFDHMTSMIKVDQEPRTYLAEKATGSGIQNLLFADIRTVDDALESVRAVRPETPSAGGIAGATSTRDMGYVFPNVSLADWVKAAEEAVVAIMVEKREAVEDLEAILDVPGIDMVQFGPGDYSMSIGRPGDYTHPEVMKAQKYTIETCIDKGIRPRIEIGKWEDAKPYMDMGVIDFCIGTDVNIIYDYMQEQGGELAKALGR